MKMSTSDGRSSLAKGVDWATRISTACITMVLPCVGGFYLDKWLGTLPVFLLIGLVLGMGLGVWRLVRIAQVLGESMDGVDAVKKGLSEGDDGSVDS